VERRVASDVSRTALGVGVLRALHPLIDKPPLVLDDPISTRLFGVAARARLDRDFAALMGDANAHALRGHVLVRSAFAEDRLQQAVARGVRQAVVLGAGFDTFAYRQPSWMDGVRLFEVDAPVTQADKRTRLRAAGIAEPANVVYAPVDFERTSLRDGLLDAGVDLDAPAFFSWLGVMVYLSREAIDTVFATIGAMPPSTEIAFTFSQGRGGDALSDRVAAIGEPLRTFVSVAELEALLRTHGFHEITVLTVAQSQRYLGSRTDNLSLPPRESIAAAIV
jgi:methyltransferase (TIGR00027 family)